MATQRRRSVRPGMGDGLPAGELTVTRVRHEANSRAAYVTVIN
jgi:hypothetical protein